MKIYRLNKLLVAATLLLFAGRVVVSSSATISQEEYDRLAKELSGSGTYKPYAKESTDTEFAFREPQLDHFKTAKQEELTERRKRAEGKLADFYQRMQAEQNEEKLKQEVPTAFIGGGVVPRRGPSERLRDYYLPHHEGIVSPAVEPAD